MRSLKITFLMLVLSAISCKKNESEQLIDVLTAKTWKFGLKDLNTATNPKGSNLYFAVDEYDQDDTFTFKTDGTVVRNYGAKKRVGNTAVSTTLNYSFNKQDKQLTIDGVKYIVVEENKTQFKYYAVMPGANGVNNVIYMLQ